MYAETRRAAWVEVHLGRIAENYRLLKAKAKDAKVLAALKADAFGHGAVKIAWGLIRAGVDYLSVATLEEAVALRQAGIRTPIVLYGATPRSNSRDIVDLGLTPLLTTLKDAELLQDAAQRANKHIDSFIALDTGMGRIGFLFTEHDVGEICKIAKLPNINIIGLFSHFATADETDKSFAEYQIGRFERFRQTLATQGIQPPISTMANSAAVIQLPQAHFDAIRPGIALYGLYPSEEMDHSLIALQPAMSVKANIVYLKKVPSGFSVSYGRKFTTQRNSLIATLPLGYADGLGRILSGKAQVLVRGRRAPIVGTICMDQCMIDVTDIPDVQEYDEVVLLGEQDGQTITAEEIAQLSGTINYEIVCRFGQRLPKIYIS